MGGPQGTMLYTVFSDSRLLRPMGSLPEWWAVWSCSWVNSCQNFSGLQGAAQSGVARGRGESAVAECCVRAAECNNRGAPEPAASHTWCIAEDLSDRPGGRKKEMRTQALSCQNFKELYDFFLITPQLVETADTGSAVQAY